MKTILTTLVSLFILSAGFSQVHKNREKVLSYFGFQIKPVFPGVFIGTTSFESNKDGFNTTFSQDIGYSFGGVVRIGITPFIALETGINMTQRNFNIHSSVPDSNLFVNSRIRYMTYDVPVSALFYIKMAERAFMNVSLGAALSYNSSVSGVKLTPSGHHEIHQTALGKKVIAEAIGNIGFAYRSPKSGTFYLGAAVRVPFEPLFYLRSEYRNDGFSILTDTEKQGRVDASYIALELKYFFPLIKIKGSPIRTPIE